MNLMLRLLTFFYAVELESTVSELEESHSKLATLKVTKDSIRGVSFPVLNFGNKHTPSDKVRDKQRDLQEMESVLKDLQVGYFLSFYLSVLA